MIENRARNAKRLVMTDHAVRGMALISLLSRERILQPKGCGPHLERRIDLGNDENKIARIPIDEIPMIPVKLVIDAVGEFGRPIEADRLLAPHQHPQQAIKAGEVIDVGMRDKDLVNALDLPR